MNELTMTLDEMISKLDGAAGRLLVMAMRDPTIKEAMEMINEVSIALGEVSKIEFVNYDDESEAEQC